MKRTHIIKDQKTSLFFREVHPGVHQPDADEEHADFYTVDDALAVIRTHYSERPDDVYEVKEGSASNYMRWLGRQSGKVMTPKKRRAQAKRARNRKGLTWKWKTNRSANTI